MIVTSAQASNIPGPDLRLRRPSKEDGAAVWRLIDACAPLDANSMYCNLLQCDHFAQTCVLAERAAEVVGWISAYRLPADPGTLFVWQVAVSPEVRGEGLGRRMLDALLDRPACQGVTRLQTTITDENAPSRALFEGLAERLGAPVEESTKFCRERHFDGRHASERLVTIALADRHRAAA